MDPNVVPIVGIVLGEEVARLSAVESFYAQLGAPASARPGLPPSTSS